MSDHAVIFLLFLCIVFLIGIILYQQFDFHAKIQTTLRKISEQFKEIADTDSGGRSSLQQCHILAC